MRATGAGLRFNEYGEMVSTRVVIVYGSPASGKTTYVRQNMKDGDMVVDLDHIKQAISMTGKTEAPDTLLNAALAIREFIYGLIERREVSCDAVWVVAALPKKKDREELRRRLNAELVFCKAAKAECIKRAYKDSDRSDKDMQVRIIERWFRNYEA